jgi:hypothetical protein
MTSAHVLYIPTIFILGFISGLLIRNNSSLPMTIGEGQPSTKNFRVTRIVLLSSLVVFLLVFIGTHFFEIPRSSKAVMKAINNQEIFDKSPSYTSDDVYARISNFPEDGRHLYQQFTYTIDVLFPLTFFAFLLLLSQYVGERSSLKTFFRFFLLSLPVLWFISDMIENATIYHLLSVWPQKNFVLAGALGYITIAKFSLLLASILAPAIALFAFKSNARSLSHSGIVHNKS